MKHRNICFVLMVALVAVWSFFAIRKYFATKEYQPWIKVEGNILTKGGRPFRFIGANAVYLVFYDDWDLDIEKAIKTAKEANLSVLRLYMDWGWGKDEDYDRILDIASRHGIYVMLTLTDCCCSGDYSSSEKYFNVHAPFCNITNKQALNVFKKRLSQIVKRKNSINGKIYREDSTIIAWDIANELEFQHFDKSDIYKWINEIAACIKSLDRNHLVTIGINANDPKFSNDNSLYEIFNAPDLDFFSFHFYPSIENLSVYGEGMARDGADRINSLTKKFISFAKPVLISELGVSNSSDSNVPLRSNQPEVYNLILREMMDTAFIAGASGVMFWGWGVPEEKNVPMWWNKESHSIKDEGFCHFLRKYKIPN